MVRRKDIEVLRIDAYVLAATVTRSWWAVSTVMACLALQAASPP